MTLEFTEPLFLLSAQTGLSVSELRAQAAEGNPDVSGPQAILKTGEPIPIVFCRRREINSVQTGGAMVAPKASEGSFSNDVVIRRLETSGTWTDVTVTKEIYVKLLLVVSQGEIGSIQIRDMFYGNCRRGTYNQGYDARAGSWSPGNTIDDYIEADIAQNPSGTYSIPTSPVADAVYKMGNSLYSLVTINAVNTTRTYLLNYREHKMPTFCGTSGSYSGLTTLSFEITLAGSTDWNKQISAFIRDGLQVTRIIGGGTGASDNFVDLAKYLMLQSGRLPSDLIDDSSLSIAANFTDANNFLFNGVLAKSENLSDWLQKTSYNFLLRLTNTNGKFGLRPRLPYNTNYTIKTTTITPEFTFTEDHVLGGGFEIDFVSLEDREPVCVVAQWRQQPEADFGLVRTVNVRYQGEAASGPFVSMDLSGYCVTENHAIKAATYKLATRKHVTHHLRLKVRERNYNSTLEVGDIVRVRLRRETSEGEIQHHDKVYEIARIEKTFGSLIKYDLTHFPVDNQGRSIVAKAVNDAVGAGNVINVGRSTHDCDTNSSTSTTNVGGVTSTQGNPPSTGDTESNIPTPGANDQDSTYPGVISNPADPIDESVDDTDGLTHDGAYTFPAQGDNAQVARDELVCNGRVCFYRVDKDSGERTLKQCVDKPISGPFSSIITTADIDHYLVAEGQCLDPSSPDGYGEVIDFGQIGLVAPDFGLYRYVRWTGTKTKTSYDPSQDSTTSVTTTFLDKQGNQWDGDAQAPRINGLCMYTLNNNYIPQYGCKEADGSSSYICGPCEQNAPWRSGVWAVSKQFETLGGTPRLGGLRAGTGGCQPFPPEPSFHVRQFNAGDPDVRETYRIQGTWQFSNDQSTIDAEWDGSFTGVVGGPQPSTVPAGADPGNPTYICS
tara:strand:- start:112 stop:2784 length:2673 start_codon:yes stop_codon:yes gene_type:complete